MNLPNDVSRCNGATVNNAMQDVECGLRDRCERYLQKDTGGERTPISGWLCGETPKYFIEVEQ